MKSEIDISSPEKSTAFAMQLAKKLTSGSIVTLKGDLGAGKTFIAGAIINHILETNQVIASPTFQLLQIYNANGFDIYHYDLYRLKHKEEIYEIGIEEAMNGKNIVIIEWPELIMDMLPRKNTTHIEIGFDGDSRVCGVLE